MAVEAGATSGIVPGDAETARYLREEAGVDVTASTSCVPDAGRALRTGRHRRCLGRWTRRSPVPIRSTTSKPVDEIAGTRVDQVVIGSCTNGRLDDLEVAAGSCAGKKVAHGTRMLVFPASGEIYARLSEKGTSPIFMAAGAVVMNPGCGPCLGVHQGALGRQ